jgi:hypothetical protein
MFRFRFAIVLRVFAGLIFTAPPLFAQETQPWTTVGSAGTVDEASLPLVLLGSPVPGAVGMRIVPALISGVNIRYNVVAVPGLINVAGIAMTVRYRDHGNGESVRAQLKQYNVFTGITTTLLEFNSNVFVQADTFQVQSVGTGACIPPFLTLNFQENSYFVDVFLTRNLLQVPPINDPPVIFFSPPVAESASPGPALAMIQLTRGICIQ